jgi:hypothetical protein
MKLKSLYYHKKWDDIYKPNPKVDVNQNNYNLPFNHGMHNAYFQHLNEYIMYELCAGFETCILDYEFHVNIVGIMNNCGRLWYHNSYI